jgi:hypothetical protein
MTRRIKKPGAKGAGKGKGNGSDNYEVGYGKPPVHTQFQKGRSGNPKGKPKGRKNTKTMIRDIAFAPIEIQVQGKTQKITAYEATLMKLRQGALSGDFRSAAHILHLAQSVDDEAAEKERSEVEVAPFDRRLLISLMRDYLEHNASDADEVGTQSTGAGTDGENE